MDGVGAGMAAELRVEVSLVNKVREQGSELGADIETFRDKSTGTNTERTGYRELMAAVEDGDIQRLEDAEGECIAVKSAETTEYDGTRQLSPVDGLISIEAIQQGVGHTKHAETDGGQSTGDTAADGGRTETAGVSPDDDGDDPKSPTGNDGGAEDGIPKQKVVTTLKALVEFLDDPPEYGARRAEVLDRAVEEEGIDRDRAAARLNNARRGRRVDGGR